ncbi:hypothetical protein H257_04859 [Aphanomyces astaci]|uniref:Alpha-type protein kinase domain-containing protein n=1 Tax=Aphanomyces astaci TaxID=112090 RepID=W4GV09_APHAT|nr:hypothetical protein H257_04859 [Aphanomyces astaci]ETV83136.1 hypothetical protein H257_04859 [Aphanomyces astaci]|eukprot:XP_009827807.1 hypothetical protein H257_04859 [Aphanomyces astaci]
MPRPMARRIEMVMIASSTAIRATDQSPSTIFVTVFNVTDPVNVCSSVATATQQTVACDRATDVQAGAPEFTYKFATRPPLWSSLQTRHVTAARYECDPASLSKEDLYAPMSTFVGQRVIRITPRPFARGCERAAFYAQTLGLQPQNSTSHMKTREGQAMAVALTRAFNNLMNKNHSTFISLTFLEASVAKLDEPVEFVAMERLLSNFERFSNSVDWHSPLATTEPCVQYAVAFTHWTWAATNGYLMVVDLQGQRVDHHTLVLTDPAIHCIIGVRFAGGTNLGPRGMAKFLPHTCAMTIAQSSRCY